MKTQSKRVHFKGNIKGGGTDGDSEGFGEATVARWPKVNARSLEVEVDGFYHKDPVDLEAYLRSS